MHIHKHFCQCGQLNDRSRNTAILKQCRSHGGVHVNAGGKPGQRDGINARKAVWDFSEAFVPSAENNKGRRFYSKLPSLHKIHLVFKKKKKKNSLSANLEKVNPRLKKLCAPTLELNPSVMSQN